QVQLDELFALLSAVKAGEVSETEAIQRLSALPPVGLGGHRPGEQGAVSPGCRGAYAGHGPTPGAPRRPRVSARLCRAVSDRWLQGVRHGAAEPLWAVGAALAPADDRPLAQAALDAAAPAPVCPGSQNRAPAAPGAGAAPGRVRHA